MSKQKVPLNVRITAGLLGAIVFSVVGTIVLFVLETDTQLQMVYMLGGGGVFFLAFLWYTDRYWKTNTIAK